MNAALESYLTLDELAIELGVTTRTIRRWVTFHSPGLPVTRIGRRPFVHRDDLRSWLESHRVVRNPRAMGRDR